MKSSKICLSICLFILSQCLNLVDSTDHDHTQHSNRFFDSRNDNSPVFSTGYVQHNSDYTPYGYDCTRFNSENPVNRPKYTTYGPNRPETRANYNNFGTDHTHFNYNYLHNYYNGPYYENCGTSYNPDLTSSPLKYRSSTTSHHRKRPFKNNSNNLSIYDSGKAGYRSPYQIPRYLIANQGKLPPEYGGVGSPDSDVGSVDSDAGDFVYGYNPGFNHPGYNGSAYPDPVQMAQPQGYSGHPAAAFNGYPNGFNQGVPGPAVPSYPEGHGSSHTPVQHVGLHHFINGVQPELQTLHNDHYYYIRSRPRYIHPKLRPRRQKQFVSPRPFPPGPPPRRSTHRPVSSDDDGFIPIPNRSAHPPGHMGRYGYPGPFDAQYGFQPGHAGPPPGFYGFPGYPMHPGYPGITHPFPPTHPPKKPPQNLLILDIAYVGHTNGYSMTVEGSKKIFKANSSYLFRKVLNGSEVLWSYNNNGYPNKVVYKIVNGEYQLKVYFPSEKPKEPSVEPAPEAAAVPAVTKAAAHIPAKAAPPAGGLQIPTNILNLQIPRVAPKLPSFAAPEAAAKVEQPHVSLSVPTVPAAVPGVAVGQAAGIPTPIQVPPPVVPQPTVPQPTLKPQVPVQPMASVVQQPAPSVVQQPMPSVVQQPIPSVPQQPVTPEPGISFQPTVPGVAVPQQPVVPGPPAPQQPVAPEPVVHPTVTPHVQIPSPQPTHIPKPPAGSVVTQPETLDSSSSELCNDIELESDNKNPIPIIQPTSVSGFDQSSSEHVEGLTIDTTPLSGPDCSGVTAHQDSTDASAEADGTTGESPDGASGGDAAPPASQQPDGSGSVTTPDGRQSAGQQGQDSSAQPETPTLTLFIKDPSDESKTVGLHSPELTPADPNDLKFVSYKFEDHVKITEVKYKNASVWKFNTKTNLHPTSVAWHESYKLVILQFDDSYWFFTKLKNETGWRSRGLGTSTNLEKDKIKLYSKDPNDTEGSTLIELPSDKYEFRDLGFGFEYVFNEDTKCEKLEYDGASIFRYDANTYNNNYPKVLYLFGDRSGQVFFAKSAYPLLSPINIVLSLKDDKAGTSKFDYKKDGNVVTYTVKQGFGFSAVTTTTGGGCCSRNKALFDIWQAKDAVEYAIKVTLNGKGQKSKTVTIHLADGTKKEFKKDNKNPWNEVPQENVATTGTGQPGSRRGSAASNSGAANGGSTSRKNSTASVTSNS